jgi:hypothetical protein
VLLHNRPSAVPRGLIEPVTVDPAAPEPRRQLQIVLASTSPVVVACTFQTGGLKRKVLDDLAGICAEGAAPVKHVAYFSVHAISGGVTHDLQQTAREEYGLTLEVFCGADIASFLAQQDLVWVARHYVELPSHLVPPPEREPAPQW